MEIWSSNSPRLTRAARGWTGGIVALALAGAMAVQPAAGTEHPPLFGSREVRSDDLVMFTKWTAALERARVSHRRSDAGCVWTVFHRCNEAAWRAFLDSVRGLAPMARLVAVNRYMNRKRYILDPRNYGVDDYWAAPLQFLDRDGDCEDYAIAKFLSLKALGFTDDDMRIVVLQDLNLGVAHAVLVVYLDGRALVLDNQIEEVVATDVIRHYRPIYSINETSWWLHLTGVASAPEPAGSRAFTQRRAASPGSGHSATDARRIPEKNIPNPTRTN